MPLKLGSSCTRHWSSTFTYVDFKHYCALVPLNRLQVTTFLLQGEYFV